MKLTTNFLTKSERSYATVLNTKKSERSYAIQQILINNYFTKDYIRNTIYVFCRL